MHPWSGYVSFFTDCLYKLRHGVKVEKNSGKKIFWGCFFEHVNLHSHRPLRYIVPWGIPPLNIINHGFYSYFRYPH